MLAISPFLIARGKFGIQGTWNSTRGALSFHYSERVLLRRTCCDVSLPNRDVPVCSFHQSTAFAQFRILLSRRSHGASAMDAVIPSPPPPIQTQVCSSPAGPSGLQQQQQQQQNLAVVGAVGGVDLNQARTAGWLDGIFGCFRPVFWLSNKVEKGNRQSPVCFCESTPS